MKNSITKHAEKRFRQRGLSKDFINLIEKYGHISHVPGGAIKIILTRKKKNKIIKELNKFKRRIEKASGTIIIEKDSYVLTGYHLS